MKVVEVKYTKRFNLGNYEHEEISLTAAVEDDGDMNIVEEILGLKTMAESAHSGATKGADEEQAPLEDAGPEEEETPEEKPKAKPAKKSKPAPTTAPSKEVEEDGTDEETVDEDGTDEEEEEEKPAPKKKFKKSGTVYQRSNETHKKIFADHLTNLIPKWKASEASKAKAKKLSLELDGKDFLDADGKGVPSFIAALKKGMK